MMPKLTRETLQTGLHPVRFNTYLAAAEWSLPRAIELYHWNVRLSSAWYETLVLTEVFLRNRIDRQLGEWNQGRPPTGTDEPFTAEWTARAARPLNSMLSTPLDRAQRNARTARSRRTVGHPRSEDVITHDDLVAQLTFGVYVGLLPARDSEVKNHTQRRILWREGLGDGFPHRPAHDVDGREIGAQAARLHTLRNRIAHAEPLLTVRSDRRLSDVGRLLTSMDPRFAGWVTGASRVRHVVRDRPI